MLRRCGQRGIPTPKERRLCADRGIRVCEEWLDYDRFAAWLGDSGWVRKGGLFVTRVDKTKGYSPDNCVVVDKTECENLRSNVFRIGGKTVRDIIGSLPKGRSCQQKTVRQRISVYKWPVEEALSRGTTPRTMLTKLGLKVKI